ncbi:MULTISPECIES: OmpA family protein [unclassified Herbaspirillum]|uniref:OmpA family protein n=1 Tax=unclassified Herbaspirillum TaxID=2624150 RepID=UPI001152FAF7|nr:MULTISPECIES: OmpA family protein [unclassified Herbaspirillum]MBB5390617.1 outer membrane protein OmpA-like peptidoglycan-associated protein [Herbaspirillum sp. SJZ102]TQK08896.1 outer membrane protein OmpA-like peptidoglycan-associated protein [Herbaspirillum sp. SJZ130]TQK14417.1 outer membrane protein OmpA-like peptidoglycan-associated protein [Herbaspirillum sp. SJZ106]
MNKSLALCLAVLALAGCAGPTERFVLLPQPDGSTSSIVVKTAAGEAALATPYASVESASGKIGKAATLSESEVQARYAPVMQSLPLRPRTYELLFELGSDRLTPASRKLLEEAIEEFRTFPAGEFILVGHADNIGSDAINESLSVRRAQLVERELIRARIAPLSIEVVGKGAREPRIPQKKGVPEPRNRFVEIRIR